jgi:hypothetical protein
MWIDTRPRSAGSKYRTVGVHAVVPDVELGHPPVAPHAPAVSLETSGYGGGLARGLEPVLPRRHDQARSEALEVPFEGPGQGLVEIAKVERQVSLRRGPQAEVQHMGTTAELHDQPAIGLRGEIGGHDGRGTPVVIPRRSCHAVVAQWNELREPQLVLGQDCLQRVVPALRFRPVS